ncbi:MAG: CPBP family intramembrane metalloprotease [Hyphomicrobiales bacterium]|nr:CPBP family intramembrane metalloprotease [Hyphomicrobiales bacterium]
MTDLAAPALPRPWGVVMTTIWTGVVLVAGLVATLGAVAVWFPQALSGAIDLEQDSRSFGILFTAAVVAELAVLVVAARLAGWRAIDYLALTVPGRRDTLVAVLVVAVFVVSFDGLTWLVGKDIVTPFQIELYRSAERTGSLPLLWLTLVVAAPVGEEVLFRGFLYRGWAPTPRAVWPAIAVIAALWAVVHTQYDWFGILQIFLIGLLLGWARWRSGSTLLTILLHGLINAWATLQTIARLNWFA